MTLPDTINGCFEALGAGTLSANVWMLWLHKEIRGIHYGPTVYFTLWGFWNLFYYPSLHQWMSFMGGVAIATVNVVWLTSLLVITMRKSHAS